MSLQDRHAKSENVRRVGEVPVTADSLRGRPANQGFSAEEHRGVAGNRGVAVIRGVPDPMPRAPVIVQPTTCSATTKKGEPCKARPTVSGLCVGHERAAIGA